MAPASAQLNVSVMEFDPGIPEDYALHRELQVFPKIREIESKFLPFVLRQSLVDSGNWGAVRVVPGTDDAAEILIAGTITHSDGQVLSVELRATDSRGELWVEKIYSTRGRYEELFSGFVGDLQARQESLDRQTVRGIAGLSAMRYAAELAPDAFGDYFEALPNGKHRLLRLPADGDPMMARIERVRSVEYVMTDAIDEKFRELYEEVDSVYAIWRKYRQWYTNFKTEEAKRNEFATANGEPGSYEYLRQLYDNYRLDRLAAQEQDKWIVGFDNEMAPVIAKMEERIAEMNGWVEEGYVEWRRILGELFEIESGLE
jgi:hypothetical protein